MSYEPHPLQTRSYPESNAVLRVSSQTIFRHVPFTVEFSATPSWLSQHSIRPEDILYAGLRMRVLKVRTNEEVKECAICSKGRKVIEVGVQSNQKFIEGKIENGRNTFVFDRCRSNCSSSRNHHKEQLYLTLDINQQLSVSSQPFSIRSRVLTPKSKDAPEKLTLKKSVVCIEGDQGDIIEKIKKMMNDTCKDAHKIVFKKYSDLTILYIHINEDMAQSVLEKVNSITQSNKEEKQGTFIVSSLQ